MTLTIKMTGLRFLKGRSSRLNREGVRIPLAHPFRKAEPPLCQGVTSGFKPGKFNVNRSLEAGFRTLGAASFG